MTRHTTSDGLEFASSTVDEAVSSEEYQDAWSVASRKSVRYEAAVPSAGGWIRISECCRAYD